MAVLNARLGSDLDEPLHAPVILFSVGLLASLVTALGLTGSVPDISKIATARPMDFAGGLIVAFYVISVTLVAPRFGVANVILFAMVAQIICATVINHFGLFDSMVRPVNLLRLSGIGLLVIGLCITQLEGIAS